MMINTNAMISITEANQNFSKVAKMVDTNGAAVILKNNTPRYLIVSFDRAEGMSGARDEDVSVISDRLIRQSRQPMRNDRGAQEKGANA